MLNFFVAIPMFLLSRQYLVNQPVSVPFPPPPSPPMPPTTLFPPAPPAPELPAMDRNRKLTQRASDRASSAESGTMVVTFPCLWSTDGTSSLCKQTAQGFQITVVSAALVLTAWLAGPLAAFAMEEGSLRTCMIVITVTAVAAGALLDLILVIVVGSASYRMWESYASLDAAGIPGNIYRTEVHGLAVTVAVMSGLSIPLNPSLLMLFTRAVERYVDRRWPGRIPHEDLSSGGKTAAEVLEEKQRRQYALGVASAPVSGGARVSTDGAGEGAGGRRSGSGHAGTGTGPTQRSSRSVTRGADYRI